MQKVTHPCLEGGVLQEFRLRRRDPPGMGLERFDLPWIGAAAGEGLTACVAVVVRGYGG